jgi:hypothetical protein
MNLHKSDGDEDEDEDAGSPQAKTVAAKSNMSSVSNKALAFRYQSLAI